MSFRTYLYRRKGEKRRILIIATKNKKFLDQNIIIPRKLAKFLLSQLEPGEILYWCDIPLYKYRQALRLRNVWGYMIMSISFCVLFAIISSFIVVNEMNANVVSWMGAFTAFWPLLAGIHYSLSLREMHTVYALTDRRALFVQRKGFLRTNYTKRSYMYANIKQILSKEIFKYPQTYGNIYFSKDIKIKQTNPFVDWKIDPDAQANLVGFRKISNVVEVEQLLQKLLEKSKTSWVRVQAPG